MTLADSVSGENLLPGSQMAVFSLCLALLGLFYKGINPIMRASSSWPNQLSKAPSPNTITLELEFLCMNFKGNHSVYTFMCIYILHYIYIIYNIYMVIEHLNSTLLTCQEGKSPIQGPSVLRISYGLSGSAQVILTPSKLRASERSP